MNTRTKGFVAVIVSAAFFWAGSPICKYDMCRWRKHDQCSLLSFPAVTSGHFCLSENPAYPNEDYEKAVGAGCGHHAFWLRRNECSALYILQLYPLGNVHDTSFYVSCLYDLGMRPVLEGKTKTIETAVCAPLLWRSGTFL